MSWNDKEIKKYVKDLHKKNNAMKINVIDKTAEYETIINMQKALISNLRTVAKARADKIENFQYHLAQNYEKGWKDAVKKIDNFIERHCKEYE